MQRLKRQQTRTERGAVAVVVALLMVPLIGFAAIGIDVASMWSEKQRLQVAADAAALAIAQDCARNTCGVPAQTASAMTAANFGGAATAAAVTTSDTVSVRTQTMSSHVFAPLLGFDSTNVSASAAARWGAPSGGTAILPLAFSWCEWYEQTGGGEPSQTTERTIESSKGSKTECTGPSNLLVPGGFGWLDPNVGSCGVTSSISGILSSSPGASGSGCSSTFENARDEVVLLPLFDNYGGTGSNAWYRVYGYVAFRITGYDFPAVGTWNNPGCSQCIKGYFTQYVDLDDAFNYSASAPNLGAMIVELTG